VEEELQWVTLAVMAVKERWVQLSLAVPGAPQAGELEEEGPPRYLLLKTLLLMQMLDSQEIPLTNQMEAAVAVAEEEALEPLFLQVLVVIGCLALVVEALAALRATLDLEREILVPQRLLLHLTVSLFQVDVSQCK
jgi:hypothetical protein